MPHGTAAFQIRYLAVYQNEWESLIPNQASFFTSCTAFGIFSFSVIFKIKPIFTPWLCIQKWNSRECKCYPGWAGKDCGQDVDECGMVDDKACGGPFEVCKNVPGSYRCECVRGFQKVVVSSGAENEIISIWVRISVIWYLKWKFPMKVCLFWLKARPFLFGMYSLFFFKIAIAGVEPTGK